LNRAPKNEYIRGNLVSLKVAIDAVPREHRANWDKLNALFLSVLES